MEHSLDVLNERLEQLVSKRSESILSLSESHRRKIADNLAKKSLHELNEIARRLEVAPI